MPPRKRGEGSFWQKASFIAANDNNTVAIYRLFNAFVTSLALALIYHYGSDLSTTQQTQGVVLAAHTTSIELLRQDHIRDQAATEERLKMLEDRDIRMLDRLNVNTNDITALKTLSVLPRR